MEILPILLGGDEFAFRVELVGSIMAVPCSFDVIAGAKEYVKGHALYRGGQILVQDLRRRFGYSSTSSGVMLIVDDERGTYYGFVVDDVQESKRLRQGRYALYEPLPTGTLLDPHVEKWLELRGSEVYPNGFHLLRLASLG